MKKLLAILLVCCFVFAFVACGGDGDTSSTPESVAESTDSNVGDDSTASSEATSSDATTESSAEATSSETATTSEDTSEASSEAATSEDTSSEETTSNDTPAEVVFTNKYISWGSTIGKGLTSAEARADNVTLKLSKINESVVAGDVGLFTRTFGKTIKDSTQDYADFAIAVFTYDHSLFGYKLTSISEVGKGKKDQAIPADGYVVAIHKSLDAKITAIKGVDKNQTFFPHGVTVNPGLNTTIKKASTAPTIDGNVSKSEYGNVVWKIEPKNTLVSYEQFPNENYYATAEVYMTYDDEYLYLGVVVSSPYHYNPLTAGDASSMWQYECIQVNTSALAAGTDYISKYWDNIVDSTAVNEGVVRQYGFAVNDSDETIQCLWMGDSSLEQPKVSCKRVDADQKTYYEAAIPFASMGKGDNTVTGKKGTKIGVSVSINSTNQDDKDSSKWKNIILRDGGGIIGLNDWSKVPVITLG